MKLLEISVDIQQNLDTLKCSKESNLWIPYKEETFRLTMNVFKKVILKIFRGTANYAMRSSLGQMKIAVKTF